MVLLILHHLFDLLLVVAFFHLDFFIFVIGTFICLQLYSVTSYLNTSVVEYIYRIYYLKDHESISMNRRMIKPF